MDAWAARIRRVLLEYYQSDDAYFVEEGAGRIEVTQLVANTKSDYRNLLQNKLLGSDTRVVPAVRVGGRGAESTVLVFTYAPSLTHRAMESVYGAPSHRSSGGSEKSSVSKRRRRDVSPPPPSATVPLEPAPPPQQVSQPTQTSFKLGDVPSARVPVRVLTGVVFLILWTIGVVVYVNRVG